MPPIEIPRAGVLLERLRAAPAFVALEPRLPARPPLYLVGGAVRDLLAGGAPDELDLVAEGDAALVATEIGDGPPRVHARFGTATVQVAGRTIDLAAARRERYPAPGALPEVEPAELEEDLRRRDFTLNALAIGLNGPAPGKLHGVPGGLEDLHAGRLRVLHPASFRDDPTRLLRLARYAGRLGYEIEPATRQLAEEARDTGALRTVSDERVAHELRLLAGEAEPVAGFAVLRELGLDGALAPGYGLADPAVARRALALLGDSGERAMLVLGLAAAGAPAGSVTLGSDDAAVREVAAATRELAPRLAAAQHPSEIAGAVGRAAPEAVAAAGALGGPDAARAAERWLRELRHVQLAIGGDDLLAAGIPAGPAIGAGLRAALTARLDGRAPDRGAELAEAIRAAHAHR